MEKSILEIIGESLRGLRDAGLLNEEELDDTLKELLDKREADSPENDLTEKQLREKL